MSFDIALFNRIADQYDSLTGGATPQLARYILSVAKDVFDPDSIILDNACGTAVLTTELLRKIPVESVKSKGPIIHSIDGAERMIDNARSKLDSLARAEGTRKAVDISHVSLAVMAAESLSFPDSYLTHSFTIAGLQHFSQPATAAGEIYRTLRPGGLAVITSWAYLGHVDVARQAQMATKPDAPPYESPTDKKWFSDEYVESVVRSAGFESVESHRKDVFFATPTLVELRDLIWPFYASVCDGWNTEEKAAYKEEMLSKVKEIAEEVGEEDGEDGSTRQVGLRMTAIVVVARK